MEDINKVVENIKDDIDKYASEVGSNNAEGRVEGLTDANLTVLGDNDAVTGLATQFAHLVPTLRSIAQGGHQSTNLNDEQNA